MNSYKLIFYYAYIRKKLRHVQKEILDINPSSWIFGSENLPIASKNYQENYKLEINKELLPLFSLPYTKAMN